MTHTEAHTPNRITADEARGIAGPGVLWELDKVYVLIRQAAEKGEFSICLCTPFWSNNDHLTRMACDLLYRDGFGTEYRRVFPNVWESFTIVSW